MLSSLHQVTNMTANCITGWTVFAICCLQLRDDVSSHGLILCYLILYLYSCTIICSGVPIIGSPILKIIILQRSMPKYCVCCMCRANWTIQGCHITRVVNIMEKHICENGKKFRRTWTVSGVHLYLQSN